MATSAFTSSHANKNYNYDAFLNHRGPDVKNTFASFLYRRLTPCGLQVFLDNQELEEGQNLNTQIKEAIASASLHVAIFSPGYAESTWCLEELHLMFESGKPIIPIFYKVKPADFRWAQEHRGAYAAAFDKHENKIEGNGQPRHNSTVGKWRNALSRAADISGLDLDAFNGDQGGLLDKVVECVLKRVKGPHLVDVGKYTFGLDEKAQNFHSKVLSQQHGGRVQVVGIAGTPGVGKATLAKELFNRNSSNYNDSYFLFDVRENSKCSLPSLQKKILKGLTRLNQDVDNVDEGVESVAVDVKEMKVTVIGSPDPVSLTILLRKFGLTELLNVGPRPCRGIEEFNDLSHDITVISHPSEEFNDLSHDMKRIVLKSLAFEDNDKSKLRVMKRIAAVEGVYSVTVNVKEMKVTVIGSADPVCLVMRLREIGFAVLLSVGPAQENKF